MNISHKGIYGTLKGVEHAWHHRVWCHMVWREICLKLKSDNNFYLLYFLH